MTIKEFLDEIIRVFQKVGIENAAGEAKMLACHILSCDETYLFFHQNEEIDDKVLLASAALINERTKGRPIQYVIGKTNFYGIDLVVDERVLIPRPETEGLVEAVLNDIKTKSPNTDMSHLKILDLCTGSGCIAAALAANLPAALVTATDISPKAFMLARHNLTPYANVKVVKGDLFESVEGKQFDYIVSNPPYIPTRVISGLQKEVKDFEPSIALDGGESGLDIIEKILAEAHSYLTENGKIFMEIGDDQALRIREIAQKTGKFKDFLVIKDLQGQDRVFVATKI
ncbi:MAG: peptide chain release factor N(5)-glutamine methyltransferase [Bacillota bacterium]|nr:peptide chain release factor N(5)-glutamine methyltransferase [Bacillota bacterium]